MELVSLREGIHKYEDKSLKVLGNVMENIINELEELKKPLDYMDKKIRESTK